MNEILNELGLSKNESKIYLSLLKYGPMQLKDLTKTTGQYRANSYYAIEKLLKKGLISLTFEGKKKIYSAINPNRLKSILEEKENKLEKILPELSSLFIGKEKPKIDILYGKEGLKTILDDEIETGETINVIQSSETVESKLEFYLLEKYRIKRARKKMKMRILYSRKDNEWALKAKKIPLTEVRVGKESSSVTLDIYGDKTVIAFGKEPTIVRITDKETAKRFLGFFELSWKKGFSM